MKKLLLAVAVSGLSTGALAQSSVTFYGSLDAGVAYVNNVGGHSRMSLDQGTMQPDRFGFRGTEDLGGGLKALFNLETGFDVTTGAQSNTSKLFNRVSLVGLSGNLGTVTLGRLPTVTQDYLNRTSNGFQLQNFYLYSPGNFDNMANTTAADNAIRYTSPTMSGLQASFLYGMGEVAGDNKKGRILSGGLSYSIGDLKMALTADRANDRAAGYAGAFLNSVGLGTAATVLNSITTVAAGATYTMGSVRLNGQYSQTKLDLPTNVNAKQKNANVGVAWSYSQANTLNLGYGFSKLEDKHWNTLSIGNIYAFSKRTQVYAQATIQRASGDNAKAFLNGVNAASSSASQLVTSVGIHHSF